MDKNAIKKFAVWARRELIEKVSQRALLFGIENKKPMDANADTVNGNLLTASEKRQRKALIGHIQAHGYEQVMEEVAYTWFNRFCAIRFMEVNGYLPTHVRVFSDDEGTFKPQILAEAIHLEMDGLDMEKVYALKQENENEALFKYLLITQCNALSAILPGMFQRIEDYTELLLPDYLLREGSVVQHLVDDIPEEDWTDQVQIIGWLYQYYNSEPKDKVFENLKKNIKISKENIPAATQLFTPDWIVRYMVENSLGRLWVEGHPNDELKSGWKYYLEEAEQEPQVQTQLAEIRKGYAQLKPEDILCIDPCMGSGHILCYMFDVLVQIYEAYGYTAREAASMIVRNNLWGLDIDDRAAQLAYFAVMMKARQYDRRFFTRDVQPHVFAIQESNSINLSVLMMNDAEKKAARLLVDAFHDAKEYGSILTMSDELLAAVDALPADAFAWEGTFFAHEGELLTQLCLQARALGQKYHAVITNPPYRGMDDVGEKLQSYVKNYYPDSCSDLSTVFMESCAQITLQSGFWSMINIPVWMSLASYTVLRQKLISSTAIVNMLHLGRGMFGSDFGTTAFVVERCKVNSYIGMYKKFFEKAGAVELEEQKHQRFFGGTKDYLTAQELFSRLPNSIIAYGANEAFASAFETGKTVNSIATVFEGLKTRDKERFLRLWFEVNNSKWKPYAKGGAFRRWYGNGDYVVNWGENGDEVRNFKKSSGANFPHYFKPCITYTAMTMSPFTGRYIENQLFGGGGGGITNTEDLFYLLAYVNSSVYNYIISSMKSTVNFEVGQIGSIPVLTSQDQKEFVEQVAKECVSLSRHEWDSFEYSWNFQQHPLIHYSRGLWDITNIECSLHPEYTPKQVYEMSPVERTFRMWKKECGERFNQLKTNEEELNRIFIDIYGLQDELSPEVADKDVTVRKADLTRDIKSLISYAVGVMLGRYSLDRPGLAYAGGEWNLDPNATYAPDHDGILPITDDDYFDDDIVGMFVKFIETVYGKDTLEENLRFIADALGGSGTSREVIRNYFLNDFFKDHCNTYSVTGSGKRPIYWLFDAGKKNSFKCLIYMHRYRKDTIARVRTDYVHETQSRYRMAIEDLEKRVAGASSAGERVKLNKQLKKLQEQAEELRKYEEKIHHLADMMIDIDLDDGVKVNYAKFADVLAPIK